MIECVLDWINEYEIEEEFGVLVDFVGDGVVGGIGKK